MNKLSRIKIRSYKKKSGLLIPLNFNKEFPISVKRIFFIYGKTNMYRGDHAHKKCTQIFFPISGKIELILEQKKKKKIIISSGKSEAIIVPKMVWCRLKFLKKNSIVAVICDRKYEFEDYIEKYRVFKKMINNYKHSF